MIPTLIPHGHVAGEPSTPTAVGRTSKNEKIHKTVSKYRKAHTAAESVHAFELIKRTYKDAIEYRTIPAQVRGLILLIGTLTFGLLLKSGWMFLAGILKRGGDTPTFMYFLLGAFGLLVVGALLLFFLTIRLDLFRPIDEPVIFDRKNRKVYRIARAVAPGFTGLFKAWPVQAYEYDWNLVDAEYRLTISTTGSTMNTWHTLIFTVKNSPSDNRAIATFNVANPLLLSESAVGPFWEHIRRFMEEDGPHLPPGETKTYQRAPKSLWQSMGVVGPFGPNYLYWWKNHAFYNFVIHLFIPFTLPVLVAWGILNWLSYMTAVDVQWPHQVNTAVGPETQ